MLRSKSQVFCDYLFILYHDFKTLYNSILKQLNWMKWKWDWKMFNHFGIKSDNKINEQINDGCFSYQAISILHLNRDKDISKNKVLFFFFCTNRQNKKYFGFFPSKLINLTTCLAFLSILNIFFNCYSISPNFIAKYLCTNIIYMKCFL